MAGTLGSGCGGADSTGRSSDPRAPCASEILPVPRTHHTASSSYSWRHTPLLLAPPVRMDTLFGARWSSLQVAPVVLLQATQERYARLERLDAPCSSSDKRSTSLPRLHLLAHVMSSRARHWLGEIQVAVTTIRQTCDLGPADEFDRGVVVS